MFKNKKAQGLSLNTIIIAALVLIVLVVLIMIFTGRMGWFNIGLLNATSQNCAFRDVNDPSKDRCVRSSDDCPVTDQIYGKFNDVGIGEVCCKCP